MGRTGRLCAGAYRLAPLGTVASFAAAHQTRSDNWVAAARLVATEDEPVAGRAAEFINTKLSARNAPVLMENVCLLRNAP
jgi:hypothetical protein